jgi:hypothetical protein
MTATIDGQSWSSNSAAILALQVSAVSGDYILGGTELAANGLPGTSLSIAINDVAGPGTYPLGVDGVSVAGGFITVTAANGASWLTAFSGAAGTITITALNSTHIAGTFTFTASQTSNGATGSRVVTNGVFDVPFHSAATIQPLPDSVGSKMAATLNGQPWNAAIVSAGTSLGLISISGINSNQTLLFTIHQPTAPGTYALSSASPNLMEAWDPNAVKPAGSRCCWGVAGDVGSVTFTSLTKTRAKGTFTMTLSPQPGTAATGKLVVTGGTLDIGLFHSP